MSDHDGIGIALGEVRGLRVWDIEELTLKGITHSETWKAKNNRASCGVGWLATENQPEGYEDLDWDGKRKALEEWKRSHDMSDCEHGYYGMFDGFEPPSYGGKFRVSGVIRGWGETLIGTHGFRCMEAEILAICIPRLVGGLWSPTEEGIQMLRDNYPGVEIFRSELGMLSEFPITRADEVEMTSVPDTAEALEA